MIENRPDNAEAVPKIQSLSSIREEGKSCTLGQGLEAATSLSITGLPNQKTAEFAVFKLSQTTEDSYQRRYELG